MVHLTASLRGPLSDILSPLWLSLAGYALSISMTQPFIGLYALSLGADPTLVGAIYATAAAMTLAGRIPLAALTGRVGNEKVMLVGLVLTAAGMIVHGVSTTPIQMLGGSVLRGVGMSGFFPPVLSLAFGSLGDDEHRAKRLGYVLTGPPTGMAIGPALGAVVFGLGRHQAVFLVGAALTLLSSAKLLSNVKRTASVRTGIRSLEILTTGMLLVLVSRFLVSYTVGVIVAFLPVMAKGRLALGEMEIGLLFSLSAVFNLVGRPLAASVSSRLGGSGAIVMSSLMVSASAFLFSLVDQASVWLGMVIYGLGLGIFVPSSILFTAEAVPPRLRTMGLALLMAMMDAGNSAGSLVSGPIQEGLGYKEMFAVAALASLVGAAAAGPKAFSRWRRADA